MPEGGFPDGVFVAPVNPLIMINSDGTSTYTTVEYEKRLALKEYQAEPEGKMALIVWQGKYKSDVFEIRPEDIPVIL
jgi:hypothetical protein